MRATFTSVTPVSSCHPFRCSVLLGVPYLKQVAADADRRPYLSITIYGNYNSRKIRQFKFRSNTSKRRYKHGPSRSGEGWLRTTSISIYPMLRRDSSPPGPFPAHPDTAPRPGKRARIDDREPTQDRFDFVSQPPYESISPSDLAPDGGKKAHPKKQPLSCAECRRLKLKVIVC